MQTSKAKMPNPKSFFHPYPSANLLLEWHYSDIQSSEVLQTMIKQSFLRNYSLIKLYNQAQDQKNKLRVFYLRQVNKIFKEKRKKQRIEERERLVKENREQRVKGRLMTQMRTHFGRVKTEQNQSECCETEGNISDKRQRDKIDIRILDLKMEDSGSNNWQILMKNEKISNILRQSLKCSGINKMVNGQTQQNFHEIFRKNAKENTCDFKDIHKSARNLTYSPTILQADLEENQHRYTRLECFKKLKKKEQKVMLLDKSKLQISCKAQY